jgi:hypothetical protein
MYKLVYVTSMAAAETACNTMASEGWRLITATQPSGTAFVLSFQR